jgi:hypothetical protein
VRAERWRLRVPGWIVLLGFGALCVTAAEALLLGLGTGYFGSGFNSEAIASLGQLSTFLAWSWILDAGLLALCWSVLAPALSAAGLNRAQTWWLLFAISIGGPALIAAYRYNVYAVAGALFTVGLVQHAPLASSSSMVTELLGEGMLIWSVPAMLALVFTAWVTRWLGRLEGRHPAWSRILELPSPRVTAAGGLLVLLLSFAALRLLGDSFEWLRFGLERKGADVAMSGLFETLTDVDGDGFGPLSGLPDPDPFDADRNPWAREIPGNGIDENGLAGDLAPSVVGASGPVESPLPTGGPRPHLLVLYLESFRADLLGRSVNGRPVTPFLDRLAAEGAATRFAFAHTAWTLASRSHLFTGQLAPEAGGSTLIDDFKERGYEVLYFSGQDESYGDSEAMLGVERADYFYDARQDIDRRTSRSTSSVSLQVSWKVLTERVQERLARYDGSRPVFVYANLTDTHFPYVHDELDDILGVPHFDRSMIQASNAEAVVRAYENNAANVDRGCERIVALFRKAIGGEDHGILVLADHGEAFYERGRLGHGQSLDDVETRIPFIVWGIGGEWPEPVAPTDVRGLLRRNLSVERDRPRPRFVASRTRTVLQYAPSIGSPRLIGLRGVSGRLTYDFERGRLQRQRAEGDALPAVSAGASSLEADSAGASSPEAELIWRWEAARAVLPDAAAADGS